MKKIIAVLLALCLLSGLFACGKKQSPPALPEPAPGEGSISAPEQTPEPVEEDTPEPAEEDTSEEKESISVDKGAFEVKVTLPAGLMEGISREDIQKAVTEKGFKDYQLHDDGDVTYTMSRDVHQKTLETYKKSLDDAIALLLGEGEEAVPSFRRIEYSEDVSQISVYVDKTLFSAWDMLRALDLFALGAYYQLFAGVPQDEVDVVTTYCADGTEEVLETMSYRELLAGAGN